MTPDTAGWQPPPDLIDLIIVHFWPGLLIAITVASASWAAWRRCRGEGRA